MASGFNSQVNKILKKMRTTDIKEKGDQGEFAVLAICEKEYQRYGGLLYHSFNYKTDKELKGNIKRDGDRLYTENLGPTTEIDILYVSPFRVIPVEVKSYKSKAIILRDNGISGCKITDKSPVHQNEMHCRHLYSGIMEALPNGDEEYIKPIVVFVDECKLNDKRSSWQKEYIKSYTLNLFEDILKKCDTRRNNKYINLELMENRLENIMTSYTKKLPLRILK